MEGSKVFEEVDGGEDDDPDDVDEVPVKAHRFDVDRVLLVEVDRAGRPGEPETTTEAEQRAGDGEEFMADEALHRVAVEAVERPDELDHQLHREHQGAEERDERRDGGEPDAAPAVAAGG